MSRADQEAKLRVIHCHGCRKGVLVQFTSHCPNCGEANATDQIVHEGQCLVCGELVTDYTPEAAAHIEREMAEAS